MKQTIFYLEGRGNTWIYHFFVYMLGGLYYITNKQYNIRLPDSLQMEDTSKHVPEPTTQIQYPIKIHMRDILPYHREAFEIIKDKFELVEDLSIYEDYEIVSIYGETVIQNSECDHPHEIFGFLRNLFLEHMPPFKKIPGKRVFITRKHSEKYHYGVLKRYILNEQEIMEKLAPYGFEYIQLEDLNTFDKIRLFMEAEVILSSHSSALTFTMFCDKTTKIIEIMNNGMVGVPHEHINSICHTLNLDFYRYSNIAEDYYGNFNLDFNPFEEFLQSIHINKI